METQLLEFPILISGFSQNGWTVFAALFTLSNLVYSLVLFRRRRRFRAAVSPAIQAGKERVEKAPVEQVSAENGRFIQSCTKIVELHMADPGFSIKTLTDEMRMSHSSLFKKVKSVSGLSLNGFIRSVRLRKAASLFLDTDCTVSEASYAVGINDPKYFREHFNKLFGINPSEYIKKFRAPSHTSLTMNSYRPKPLKCILQN